YGEIVYSVYEKPLDLMCEDYILDNVECSKEESIIEDEELLYGEIIYVADQETIDLVQACGGGNKEQKNEVFNQNINPLINIDLDNNNHKQNISVKDMIKSNKKSSNRKEEIKSKEDKDNGVCSFNIIGVVMLVVLNM
ncbi:hypothetical protein H311_05082, partial [Anncaliia algerae PRA109]